MSIAERYSGTQGEGYNIKYSPTSYLVSEAIPVQQLQQHHATLTRRERITESSRSRPFGSYLLLKPQTPYKPNPTSLHPKHYKPWVTRTPTPPKTTKQTISPNPRTQTLNPKPPPSLWPFGHAIDFGWRCFLHTGCRNFGLLRFKEC